MTIFDLEPFVFVQFYDMVGKLKVVISHYEHALDVCFMYQSITPLGFHDVYTCVDCRSVGTNIQSCDEKET